MGAVNQQLPEDLKPAHPARVRELRDEVVKRGGNDLICSASVRAMGLVLAAAGLDIDIAATAITMNPRPDWVREVLGPV